MQQSRSMANTDSAAAFRASRMSSAGQCNGKSCTAGCKSLQIVGIVRKNGATNADEMLVCVQ